MPSFASYSFKTDRLPLLHAMLSQPWTSTAIHRNCPVLTALVWAIYTCSVTLLNFRPLASLPLNLLIAFWICCLYLQCSAFWILLLPIHFWLHVPCWLRAPAGSVLIYPHLLSVSYTICVCLIVAGMNHRATVFKRSNYNMASTDKFCVN